MDTIIIAQDRLHQDTRMTCLEILKQMFKEKMTPQMGIGIGNRNGNGNGQVNSPAQQQQQQALQQSQQQQQS